MEFLGGGGGNVWSRDFWGFWFFAPFDQPCHLKSRVPPWVPTLLASLSFSFFPFRPSFNLLTSLPFLPFAFLSLSFVTPSSWPLTFLCIPYSSPVNLLPSSPPFLSHQFCLFPCQLSHPFSFPFLLSSICLSPLLISPNLPSWSHPNRCNIVCQKLRLFAHHVGCCWAFPTYPSHDALQVLTLLGVVASFWRAHLYQHCWSNNLGSCCVGLHIALDI